MGVLFGAGIRLRCPAKSSPDKSGSLSADRCHSFGSLLPPPAALPSFPGISPSVRFGSTKKDDPKGSSFLVPATGIEPVRILLRGILSPLRLPVPPCRRKNDITTFCSPSQGENQIVASVLKGYKRKINSPLLFWETWCIIPQYQKYHTCRCDGIGRRSGLKIHRWRQRAGSSPATGTIIPTLI